MVGFATKPGAPAATQIGWLLHSSFGKLGSTNLRRSLARNIGLDARCHGKYHRGMIITIDRAGRVVVPKTLRERFNLTAGTELEIRAVGDGLELRRMDAETSLVRKHGILVHHGSARTALDVGEFIRAEREARIRRLTNDTD